MTIRYKYLLLFLFILVCICGYLFASFYEGARNSAIEDLNARQMLHAQYAGKEIEGFFDRWTERLKYLSRDDAIITLNASGRKHMEFLYAAHKSDIRGITRVDARGRVVYTFPYAKASVGTDITHQKHIKEIMSTHKPVVSDVFSAIQGFDAIALHVPVFRGGEYDGSIGILIGFSALSKRYLEHIRIGKTGYAWITSQAGIELYCPVPGHVGRSVFENCKDFPTILDMAKEMLRGKQGVTTYYFDMIMGESVKKVRKHAVYMPIKVGGTFWSIVVSSSEDEVLASLRDFRNRLLVLIAVLLLSGTIFAYYGMKAWGILQEEKKRKAAEGVLRESEQRLSDIINFLPDAILAIDSDGKVIAWNKAIEEMTGYPAEKMIGKGDYEYAIPFYGTRRPILVNFVTSWNDKIEKQYSFIKKEGDTLFTETDVPYVRGQNRVLAGKASPLYDTRGNMVGAIESIRDMTDRRQAEDAIFNEKEKLRLLSENAPFGMVLIEKDGRFLYTNPKFREIFGYDLNDVPNGREWFRKAYPDDALRNEVIGAWKSDMADTPYGQETHRVFNATCKDGSVKTINFTTVPLKDGDKIMVCEDITEQKRLERQLLNAQKMEAIGTLSGGIAHDFNNILMGIQGYASLIMLDVDPHDRQYERLKRIQEQVRSAAELTGQLLGFARGGKYVTKPVNLNELIEKTSTMFGRTKKEVAIHCKYESNIWAVEADRGQIEQVLLNLYLNAWQAMPQGGDLSLETGNATIGESHETAYPMAPGRYVRVSVSDTGLGMDESTRERVFEPFFTTKELGRGTGLGLAMVYGIVKNHNGYIDVTSEPRKGTTFALYFPASGKNLVKEMPESAGIMKGTETILVVDDEPDILTVSKEILEALGYTVHGAKSGAEAVALYGEMKGSISLVIVDMIMPGLSGSETFDRIRELNPSAKIILSSGYSLDGQAQQIMNKGCDGFIQKPFDIALMSRKIRELLDK
jgi:two-component system, cell cycle sensor histidine kinase and response regulator CckA